MPPPAILDPASLDFTNLLADREAIQRVLPHRHEFALLDGVIMCDRQRGVFAGYHDIREGAWWARGHIPGRPLFPGVLMIEAAAQLASFLAHSVWEGQHFVGLTGVDETKYRGTVVPPCRLVLVGRALEIRSRRIRCAIQGFVGNTMVFECVITGMPV